MATSRYHYALHLFKTDGTRLGYLPFSPDWGPPCQSTALKGMRSGRLPLRLAVAEQSIIEPIWEPEAGEPYAAGFRVTISPDNAQASVEDFSLTYFAPLARQASVGLVKEGKLSVGDHFNYLLVAYHDNNTVSNGQQGAFDVTVHSEELPHCESDLASFRKRAHPYDEPAATQMAAFIPAAVIEECAEHARAYHEGETGGILLGRLHRDNSIPDIFVEVTAQIAALHTKSDLARLTFTAETWSAAQAAIALRNSNELAVGWWHSHPAAMLKSDEAEQSLPENSSVNTVFFSGYDVGVTRTCFPAAYSLALVMGESLDGVQSWGLFGWHRGRLQKRGCFLLDSDSPATPMEPRPSAPIPAIMEQEATTEG